MRQGETVSGVFNGDASSQSFLVIKDANAHTRVIGPHERLIVDSVTTWSSYSSSGCTVFAGTNVGGVLPGSQLIFRGGANAGPAPKADSQVFPSEGLSLPIGLTPIVIGAGSGTIAVVLTGRIVQDGPITNQRPSWKESLTGAGIPPGDGTSNTALEKNPAIGLRAMASDHLPDGSQNPGFNP
jgi:hypothetical protein